MPFDLLALPNVARHRIFYLMPPTQLYAISQTSERCKALIKLNRFDVKLTTCERGVDVYYPGYPFPSSLHIESRNATIDEQKWRDSVIEIFGLFGQAISRLYITTTNFDETWKWINKEQSGLKGLVLTVKNIANPQETIKKILNNSGLKQLEEFSFGWETFETFQYTDPFIFKKPLKHLEIVNSSWFTVQNLMDCQVEKCILLHSKLTDEDLNLVLKNWKNQVDTLRNLQLLLVFRRYNIDVVFNGLQRESEVDKGCERVFKLTYNDEFYFEVAVCRYYLCIQKKSRIHNSQ